MITHRVVALLLACVVALPGLAQPRPREPGPPALEGKYWKIPRVREHLRLADEQVEQLDAILLQHQKRLIDLKAEVDKRHLDFAAAMAEVEASAEEIFPSIDRLENARAELAKARAVMEVELRQILTVEQREELSRLRAHMAERSRRGFGPDQRRWPDQQPRPDGRNRPLPDGDD